jgi:hypothetical protein
VYEQEGVTMLWHTAAPNMIIKKRESMHTDRCGNTRGQKCRAKGSGKEAKIQQQFIYSMKCMIIPVIIGATGTATKGLRKHWKAIPGKHSIDSLQKTAILGTSHIIRKVLQSEI